MQANDWQNSDLFRALRGGSNNFGIVTRFDFATFPQGDVWGGTLALPASAFPQLAQGYYEYASRPTDKAAHAYVAAGWGPNGSVSSSTVVHTGGQANASALEPITRIQPQLQNTLRTDTLVGITDEIAAYNPNGTRQVWFETSFKLDRQLLVDVYDLWNEAINEVRTLPSVFLFALAYHVISRDTLLSSQARGGNALGLRPEDGPFIICQVETGHTDAAHDADFLALARKVTDRIKDLTRKRGRYMPFKYLNYSDRSQDVIRGYGEESVTQLKAVSRKYDPQRFFQSNVPGGFKLPKDGQDQGLQKQ